MVFYRPLWLSIHQFPIQVFKLSYLIGLFPDLRREYLIGWEPQASIWKPALLIALISLAVKSLFGRLSRPASAREFHFHSDEELNDESSTLPPNSTPMWPLQHDGSSHAPIVSSPGTAVFGGFSQMDLKIITYCYSQSKVVKMSVLILIAETDRFWSKIAVIVVQSKSF